MMRPALHPPQPLSPSSQLRASARSTLAWLGILIVLIAPLLCPQFCMLKHWAAMHASGNPSAATATVLSPTFPMHRMDPDGHTGHAMSAHTLHQPQAQLLTCDAPVSNPQPLINEFKQAIQAVTECITASFALVVFWHWLGPILSPRLHLRLAALLPPLPPPRYA